MTKIICDPTQQLGLNASLTVRRSAQYLFYFRRIGIYVDHKQVGAIRRGETKSFELNAGQHQIFAQIDWVATAPISVALALGQNKLLNLNVGYFGWKFFSTLFLLFRNTTDLIILSEEGPDGHSGQDSLGVYDK